MMHVTIGIDVSKDDLDCHRLPEGVTARFANCETGINTLIRWLLNGRVERVVFELTGAYHFKLERSLAEAGICYAKINPRQARRFAEATGCPAKTDKVDAMMLARLGAALDPAATAARSHLRAVRGQTPTATRATSGLCPLSIFWTSRSRSLGVRQAFLWMFIRTSP